MYCVKCGVKLGDSEKVCPLCNTVVYHPDVKQPEGEGIYPQNKYPADKISSKLPQFIVTLLLFLPLLIVLIYDLLNHGSITWSGYVMGAIGIAYVSGVLPWWFKKPNPAIFVPCAFASVCLYLMYISIKTNGGWFLSFAFPVAGGVGLICTAVAVLLYYCKKGQLYILGGGIAGLGVFLLLVEFLMVKTFENVSFMGWSLYPLITLVLCGGLLIFLAVCRPARESMERRFFI